METVIYCDRDNCKYNCEGECQRTTIKVSKSTNIHAETAVCKSMELLKEVEK